MSKQRWDIYGVTNLMKESFTNFTENCRKTEFRFDVVSFVSQLKIS